MQLKTRGTVPISRMAKDDQGDNEDRGDRRVVGVAERVVDLFPVAAERPAGAGERERPDQRGGLSRRTVVFSSL